MNIKHYFHTDSIVVEIKVKNREEFEKVLKFIEFAELNAEQYKEKDEEKDYEH